MIVRFGKAQLAQEHAAHAVVIVLSSVDQYLLHNLSQLTRHGARLMNCGHAPTTETTFIVQTIPRPLEPYRAIDPRSTQDKWEVPATPGRPVPLQGNRPHDTQELGANPADGEAADNRPPSRCLWSWGARSESYLAVGCNLLFELGDLIAKDKIILIKHLLESREQLLAKWLVMPFQV